jgi:hypothetical protein
MLRLVSLSTLLVFANAWTANASPLIFAVNVTSAGTLTAAAGDSAAPGDNLTINPGVTLQSTAGSVILHAGDDLIFNSTATVGAAVDIQFVVDFGDVDGAGATANVLGHLNAPLATVSGGSLDDSFIIVPDDGTPIAVHGAGGINALTYQGALGTVTFNSPDHRSGSIAAPGFAGVTFDNIDSLSGSVSGPEPATWFLFLTALPSFVYYIRRRQRL